MSDNGVRMIDDIEGIRLCCKVMCYLISDTIVLAVEGYFRVESAFLRSTKPEIQRQQQVDFMTISKNVAVAVSLPSFYNVTMLTGSIRACTVSNEVRRLSLSTPLPLLSTSVTWLSYMDGPSYHA